jgi:hypothetical protein
MPVILSSGFPRKGLSAYPVPFDFPVLPPYAISSTHCPQMITYDTEDPTW